MEKTIVVMPSAKMDNNKRETRNEHNLLRMPKVVRANMDANNLDIELSGNNNNALNFSTFIAFADDLKKASATLNDEALDKVCFVTTKNFLALGGKEKEFIEVKASNTFLDILIGTDPELLIMKNGNVVNAGTVLTGNKTAKFGADGAMAELRPSPSKTPQGLVDNIRSVLNNEDNVKTILAYDWVSACYVDSDHRDYPVGMHIHIDNPKKVANMPHNERLRLFAVTNKIMDELLTLPMIRLDGENGHNRRAHCKMSTHNNYNTNTYGKGYGFFGEWREANGRLEHRSLSGLILSRPDLCRAVFGTAKAIAEAVYKDAIRHGLDKAYILPAQYDTKDIYKANFEAWGDIPLTASIGCTLSSKAIDTSMNKSCRNEISVAYINKWLKKVRSLSTYTKFAEEIESLGDILSCSAKTLDNIEKNIKLTWKEK